jgi:DNA repair protein RadC
VTSVRGGPAGRAEQRSALGEGHRSRLKERFDSSGLAGFAEHEILELLLFYVIPRRDTKVIAKGLLHEFKSLPGVLAANREHLEHLPGIGKEAARFLHLIRDSARWGLRQKAFGQAPVISSASDLLSYLSGAMANLPEERFWVVFVDQANVVIRDEELSVGVEDQTAVYPRLVMKRALALHATGIIVAHNHPTGRVLPSPADRQITDALAAAARSLDIRLIDHLILGREGAGYFSFRESGLLP